MNYLSSLVVKTRLRPRRCVQIELLSFSLDYYPVHSISHPCRMLSNAVSLPQGSQTVHFVCRHAGDKEIVTSELQNYSLTPKAQERFLLQLKRQIRRTAGCKYN